jgi:hypothetical protein
MSKSDPTAFLRRSGYEPGPVPEWLKRPLAAVLRDLQRPEPVNIHISYSPHPLYDSYGAIFLVEVGQESWLTSIPVSTNASHAELLVEIADGMQDQVFPELHGSWGEARPECPRHPHPAVPRLVEDKAWWVCPMTAAQIKQIGS